MTEPQEHNHTFSWPEALRQMTARYENLVKALSILRKMDEFDDPEAHLPDIFSRILEVVALGLNAENCSLMLLDEETQMLQLRAACSPLEDESRSFRDPEAWSGRKFRLGEGIVGQVAEKGEARRVDDVREKENFVPLLESPVQIRSLICYPLIVDNHTIGVLNLSHSRPAFFSAESENILTLITQRAARIFATHTLRQQIREKEEHYRLVAENAGDGIMVFEPGGALISVNPAMRRITGITSGEIGSVDDFKSGVHPGDRPGLETHWQAVMDTGEAGSLEYRYTDRSGNLHNLEQHSSPMYHGSSELRGIAVIVRDVTARKAAEEELNRYRQHLEEMVEERSAELRRANEELSREINERKHAEISLRRLATIIEQGAEIVVITDPDGVIEYVNPAFEKTTGYTRDETRGQTCRILKSGKQSAEFYHDLWQTIAAGQTWHGQMANRDKAGAIFHEAAIISPLRDFEGHIVNYVKMARDVTRERELQEHLRQSQKLEAIGALAGGIAHDFNNILYAVLGYTRLAMDGLPSESATRPFLEEVVKAGKRARDLVEQILTFGRRGEHSREAVYCQPAIRESLKLLRSTLPATIEIHTAIGNDAGPVYADPTHIHQIVMNLCTNAWHAMREKGGRLTVALRQHQPDPLLVENHPDLENRDYVILSVSDTGHGIGKETMSRIFEPYFSTKEVGEGIGLGLATVHGIVKDMHGAVLVTSEPGEGAAFDVYLPLHDRLPETKEEEEAGHPLPEGNEHILFVDDETMIANVGAIALKRLGYAVTVVTDSGEAFSIFREAPDTFDVVITDQTMPGLTGIQLARHMLAIRPDMPVILCTGYSEMVDRKSAEKAGIRQYLKKPCIDRELAEAIRHVLRKK
jgi:PAS domain S-box-containing protein